MRILALTSLYPRPGYETMAVFNRQQFQSLAARHELTVIAPVLWTEELYDRVQGRRTTKRRKDPDGIEVRHPIYYYTPKILHRWYGEFYLSSVRAEFMRCVEEFNPDVVLGCFAHPDGWAAVRLAHAVGLPVVSKVVGTDVLVLSRKTARRQRIAEALSKSDGILTVSQHLADRAIALGARPDRVTVVSNGVDRDLFRPGDRDDARTQLGLRLGVPTLLFVGNILNSKGASVLVEACVIIAAQHRNFQCYLVGRGRDTSRVRKLIHTRGLDGTVHIAGPKRLEELSSWYRASDVVTLPSYSEGIPNVLREALACGRPFVATNVGGIPEIALPGSSLLVAPGSPEALADALLRAMDGEIRGPSSAASRPIGWDESADQLASALREAINCHRNEGRKSELRCHRTPS